MEIKTRFAIGDSVHCNSPREGEHRFYFLNNSFLLQFMQEYLI